LPKFGPAEISLNLLFVTQIILASNFAANTFTTARRKYLHLSLLSFISVLVVTVCCLAFALMELPYHWMAFSTVLGAIAFSITTRLYLKKQLPDMKIDLFNITAVKIALVVILTGNILFPPYAYFFSIAGSIIYITFNRKNLKELVAVAQKKLR
jgi:hypothetical protein